MVGQRTLNPYVEVRILCPQLKNPGKTGVFIFNIVPHGVQS